MKRTPPAEPLERADWEVFVRHELNVRFIRIDPGYIALFQRFLYQRFDGDIAELNRRWGTHYAGFDGVPLLKIVRGEPGVYYAYAEFISGTSEDGETYLCPLEALSVYGPRQGYEDYLAESGGSDTAAVGHRALPSGCGLC
ncbi:MAG: hypothetical protein R3C45_01980 [Phycisphaerales bacterium]